MNTIGIDLKVGIKPVNKPTDKVILKVNGTEISQSAQEVARKLLAPLLEPRNGSELTPAAVPSESGILLPCDIGTTIDGAVYAGITLSGLLSAHLYVLPGDEKMNWENAQKWADKQGGMLPSRIDALVLFQNLKKEFKEEWYWTSQQYAGSASYAWFQSFYGGLQYGTRKGNDYRVRAVRRVIIK